MCNICKVFAFSGKKEEIHKMSRKVYCINEYREWKLFSGMWKDFIVEISHSKKDLYIYTM